MKEEKPAFTLDEAKVPPECRQDGAGFLVLPERVVLGGRWEVQRNLGCGAFAQVYLCRDVLGSHKPIALKVAKADESSQEEARDEAKLMQFLAEQHDYPREQVVGFVGSGTIKQHVVIAMEALATDLHADMKMRGKPYHASEIVSATRDLCHAVRFLHSHDLIHCDIKLNNVAVVPPRPYQGLHVKLIDFGSVRKMKRGRPNSAVVQTRSHRAPEVHLSCGWEKPVDLWSLGCIVAELHLGSVLFPASSLQESLAVIGTLCGAFPPKMVPPHLQSYFDTDGNLWDRESMLPMDATTKHVVERLSLRKLFGSSVHDGVIYTLCDAMLQIDPKLRITAEGALRMLETTRL